MRLRPVCGTIAAPVPQALALKVDRYFQITLLAMIATGFVALVGTGRLDGLSLVFVAAALILRGLHLARRSTFVLTEKATTRLTLVYVTFYLLDFMFLSGSFLTATVHLVLFIMVVTMFAVQRERYHVYLIVIAFMMVLAAAILTIDSFFLAAFFVFSLLAIATFITMEMRRSFLDAATRRTAAPSALAAYRLPRSLGRAAVALVLGIFIGIPAVFYALPRWSFGRFSQFSQRNVFVAGFGSDVKLGEIGRIQQSDQVVMHVSFLSGSQPPAEMKWRGATLATFDGRRWFNEFRSGSRRYVTDLDNHLNLRDGFIAFVLTGTDGFEISPLQKRIDYRVLLEPIGTNVIFLLPTPTALEAETRSYMVDSAGGIGYWDPQRLVRTYNAQAVERALSADAARTIAGYPPEIAKYYLQVPDTLDKRVAELTQQIVKDKASVYERARAVELYLTKTYGYTLEMQAAGDDPISFFLFQRKKGHCEYFASAMAIMLRTAGIPARVVNGFRGGEFNDVSGSYIVRARDAHSWVEAYVPGHGWYEFDPTPAGEPMPRNRWARLLLYVDAAREFWGEWVINYDFAHQRDLSLTTASKSRVLFDRLRLKVRGIYDALLARARQTQADAARDPRKYGVRTGVLLAALLLALNLRALWRWYRNRRIAARPGEAPLLAASLWYTRLTRLLRRKGFERAAGQTADEFAASIPRPDVREPVTRFAETYQRARFWDSAPDAEHLPELYDEVEEALRR